MFEGLLKSIGSTLGAAPAAPTFKIPAELPNLHGRTASELVDQAGLPAVPGEPDPKTQTVAQFLSQKLNTQQDMLGATQVIAHGLPQRDGIKWAVSSCRRVEAKFSPEHREALAAADAFTVSPTAATRARAASAADKVGPHSPAGLAAKAASMADVPDGPAVPGADMLVPTCVVGAVAGAVALSPRTAKLPERYAPRIDMPQFQLSKAPAALPPPGAGSPASARNAIAYKPFIDAGLALASRGATVAV